MTNTNNVRAGQLYVIPQHPRDKEFLLAVDKRTRVEVQQRYNIALPHDWMCNTITKCTVDALIMMLSFRMKAEQNVSAGVSFYDILNMEITNEFEFDKEKPGNIDIAITNGVICDDILANPDNYAPGNPVEKKSYLETFSLDDEEDQESLIKLDSFIRYALAGTYGVTIPDDKKLLVIAVAYTFITNIYVEMHMRMMQNIASDPGLSNVLIVCLGNQIEFHLVYNAQDTSMSYHLIKGATAKTGAKGDDASEKDLI